MSIRRVADIARPRVMGFLNNLRAVLRGKSLDVLEPVELAEPESNTWQWGIVVHLWPTPPSELPWDSLDVWVLLPNYADERIRMVDLAVQLATVEGTSISDHEVDEHGLSDTNDLTFIEEKLRALESPELLRKVANEVLEYVEKNRRNPKRPPAPKEWNPRWKRPGLGAAAAPKFPPIRINLVERPEWKERWEPGGAHMSQASDLGWEYVRNFNDEDLELLILGLAGPLYHRKAETGPKAWTPRDSLNDDDIERIVEGIKAQDRTLEATLQQIVDAATWMYEDALAPRDGDIRSALETAKGKFELERRYDLDWDLWDPLLETGMTPEGILHEMFGPAVHYDRDQGAYDRHLVFDVGLSGAPAELLKLRAPKDRAYAVRELNAEWKNLAAIFIRAFFRELEKEMEEFDLDNRIEWEQTWRSVLKSADLKSVRRELLDYARSARQAEGA